MPGGGNPPAFPYRRERLLLAVVARPPVEPLARGLALGIVELAVAVGVETLHELRPALLELGLGRFLLLRIEETVLVRVEPLQHPSLTAALAPVATLELALGGLLLLGI